MPDFFSVSLILSCILFGIVICILVFYLIETHKYKINLPKWKAEQDAKQIREGRPSSTNKDEI